MVIYIVENCETNKFEAFGELEQAATYVKKYYRDHMVDWFDGFPGGVEEVLQAVKVDLENLDADYPYIEEVMYIHDMTLHNQAKGEEKNE